MTTDRKLTTTERGLGYSHRKARERLLRTHIDGSPCWWCGKPMFRQPARNPDGRVLSADHTHARALGGTKADRLLHEVCNKQRGDGYKDHLRPAATGQDMPAEPANALLGHRAMPWP